MLHDFPLSSYFGLSSQCVHMYTYNAVYAIITVCPMHCIALLSNWDSFFFKYNNVMLKHCNRPTSCFLKVYYNYLNDRLLLMSRHNIFTFHLTLLTPYTSMRYLVVNEWRCFHGSSDNDRRRCRSVAQTSASLCINEWTSLWTFALTLQLEFV